MAGYAAVDESPVAALSVHLTGRVLSLDGRQVIELSGEGQVALALGHQLAQQALAQGAEALLARA